MPDSAPVQVPEQVQGQARAPVQGPEQVREQEQAPVLALVTAWPRELSATVRRFHMLPSRRPRSREIPLIAKSVECWT